MVGRRGQSMTEFLVVLAILTAVGFLIMYQMAGTDGSGTGGAIDAMAHHASDKIVADKD